MNVKKAFATKLKTLREDSGLSQTELADTLGVSRGSISFYENNDRTPDIEFLEKVSTFFNVSCDYLLNKHTNKTHELENMQIMTGLSQKACEILEHWSKCKEVNYWFLKSISFIIENGSEGECKFLESLYKYLFIQYAFTDIESAATFRLPENTQLYHNWPMVVFSDDIKEGRFIVEASDLNNMHFGKLLNGIIKFKEIVNKEAAQNGEHNEKNE